MRNISLLCPASGHNRKPSYHTWSYKELSHHWLPPPNTMWWLKAISGSSTETRKTFSSSVPDSCHLPWKIWGPEDNYCFYIVLGSFPLIHPSTHHSIHLLTHTISIPPFICPPIYPSFIYLSTHFPIIHSSSAYPFIYPSSTIHPYIHSFIHQLLNSPSFIQSLIHHPSFIHPSAHPFIIHLSIYSSIIHPSIHTCIHPSFIHSCTHHLSHLLIHSTNASYYIHCILHSAPSRPLNNFLTMLPPALCLLGISSTRLQVRSFSMALLISQYQRVRHKI